MTYERLMGTLSSSTEAAPLTEVEILAAEEVRRTFRCLNLDTFPPYHAG
jgi:hypothetical protein